LLSKEQTQRSQYQIFLIACRVDFATSPYVSPTPQYTPHLFAFCISQK
jgi:hypothetical protein